MKTRVHIFYRSGVFDPQGNSVAHSLRRLGFESVSGARVGKVVDLEVNETDATAALEKTRRMCEKLLANPVIETYTVEVIA